VAARGSVAKRVDDLDLVLTVPELGRVLKKSRRWAYEFAANHPDRVVRLGRSIRIPRSTVEDILSGRIDGNVA
jgi:hypothetical protein